MMCESCKLLGEKNRWRAEYGRDRGGRVHQLSHVRKAKPHCEYPATCTCRHQPVADGYVNRDGVA